MVIERGGDGLTATVHEATAEATRQTSGPRPTAHEREYLEFIMKYMAHYRVAPAEFDIARHFMVMPPSVNQMIRKLERRGFITRDRDSWGQTLPRSIRVVVERL